MVATAFMNINAMNNTNGDNTGFIPTYKTLKEGFSPDSTENRPIEARKYYLVAKSAAFCKHYSEEAHNGYIYTC